MTHHDAVETMAVERYLLGEMPEQERDTFEDHYFSCAECSEDLRTAAAMLEGARSGLAKSTAASVTPIRAARRPASVWYRSAVVPWAVAATLAVVVGYQSLWTVPSLRRGTPLVLAPVTLRPASRGAETAIGVGHSAAPISVAIEVDTDTDDLTYELMRGDGTRVIAGKAAAPSAGAPLLLLLPAWTVVPPMHYILSVHDAAGRLLGEYRFRAVTE
jgi:anti-sigma factor RsiW